MRTPTPYFSAKHLGAGQYYLMTIVDKDGEPLDGANTYRLNVPANPPVKLYWSATAYDRDTHALIRDVKWSKPLFKYAGASKERRRFDGRLLRPQSSRRAKNQTGFRQTPSGGFEVLFRLYGPEKDFFDKTVGTAGHREIGLTE